MTSITSTDTDQLAALVATKLKLVELLAQLAKRQLDLAAGGQMSELLKLLAAKQTVLDQLGQVARRLDPFRRQDPEARNWPTPADRVRCQENARRCEQVLAETMQLERQAEAEMIRRRDLAADTLATSAAAAAAHTAYAGTSLPLSAVSHVQCEG